jgi:hypothetical protein
VRLRLAAPGGTSLAELLAVVALVGLGLAAALPGAAALRNRVRLAAAAREVALAVQALRWQSVARQRAHALWFREDARGWHWFRVRDGNGNGVTLGDLESGTDLRLSGPHRIEDRIAGVRIGLPAGDPAPELPPRGGRLPAGTEPVRFGLRRLVVASPHGTATPGTLFLTDGDGGLWAVVVFGATARVRVWRYDARADRWQL